MTIEDLDHDATPQLSTETAAVEAVLHSFSFGKSLTLRELRLVVNRGEAVAVLGSSGCGKSTLIRILAGLLPRSTKETFEGRVELFGLTPPQYRAQGRLAVMFQDPTLLPHLSVEQNVRLPLELLRQHPTKSVDSVLDVVGLNAFRDYLPRDLSGGMRTRTALARAFVSQPSLLLLDEPFTGLDLAWKESLYLSLEELRRRNGTTVIMVTHDLEEAVFNSDRLLVMNTEGTIIREMEVRDTWPRPYRFGSTPSRHGALLSELASLLGAMPIH